MRYVLLTPLALLLLAIPMAEAQQLAAACPTNVQATANGDGSITLTWDAVSGATGYRIHRAVGNGSYMIDYALLPGNATSYTDANTTAGVAYSYRVMTQNTREGVEACAPVSATAMGHAQVPVFPTPLAWGAALVGTAGVLVLVISRRR